MCVCVMYKTKMCQDTRWCAPMNMNGEKKMLHEWGRKKMRWASKEKYENKKKQTLKRLSIAGEWAMSNHLENSIHTYYFKRQYFEVATKGSSALSSITDDAAACLSTMPSYLLYYCCTHRVSIMILCIELLCMYMCAEKMVTQNTMPCASDFFFLHHFPSASSLVTYSFYMRLSIVVSRHVVLFSLVLPRFFVNFFRQHAQVCGVDERHAKRWRKWY